MPQGLARIRSEIESSYKRLSFSINPLHRYTLALEKNIFESTPLIVVNSNMVKGQIQRYYGTPAGKITVAYNGVDLNKFSPANRERWRSKMRQAIGIGEHDKVILFVGSGFRRKGLEMLIHSLPEVRRDRCGVKGLLHLSSAKAIAILIGKWQDISVPKVTLCS